MTTLERYDYSANVVTQCVLGSIKIHRPSESFLGSFIQSRFFVVNHQHNVLIRELEIHGLVVIYGLIIQYTPLYCFLGCILYIVFS